MNTPHDDFDDFDTRAREAGRALRHAAPADGLARVERARHNRRLAQAGGALAAAAIGIGGIVALTRPGKETVVSVDPTIPTTLPSAPTVPTTEPSVPSTNPATTPAKVPATAPTSTPDSTPTTSVDDPFAVATAVAATPTGILLGLPDGTWVPTPFTNAAAGPAFLADRYVVHQPDAVERWTVTDAPIRIITADGVTEWTPPGPVTDPSGMLRYRVLDAGIAEGEPVMLVSQTDGGMPDTADVRLLLVGLDDGNVRDLGSFGGWEEGIGAAKLAGDRIYALRSAAVLTWFEVIGLDGTATSSQELAQESSWHLSLGTDGNGYAYRLVSDGTEWQLDSVAMVRDGDGTTTQPMTFALPADFEQVAGGCPFPDLTGTQLWCHGPNGPASVSITSSTEWVSADGRPTGVVTRRVQIGGVSVAVNPVPTVWIGGKLAGFFAGDEFVATNTVDEGPLGLENTTVELVDGMGGAMTATVRSGDCPTLYLDPPPDAGVWASPDAQLAPPPGANIGTAVSADTLAAINADLEAVGIHPNQAQIAGGPLSAGGSVDALVLTFGADDAVTWIATWDEATREFTTIEGDIDPANALAIGMPLTPYLDLDADANYEIVFSVGDAWVVRELATGDDLAAVPAHPC